MLLPFDQIIRLIRLINQLDLVMVFKFTCRGNSMCQVKYLMTKMISLNCRLPLSEKLNIINACESDCG